MVQVENDLVAKYKEMFGEMETLRPTDDVSKARLEELSANRKKFLENTAKELGFSSGSQLKKQIDKILKKSDGGKKKEKNNKKRDNGPKNNKQKTTSEETEQVVLSASELEDQMRKVLGKPEENTGRGGYYTNDKERLNKHLGETSGKWQLRFPPEPNGYLHIGHAKAMFINFGTAKANSGNCYLRFDDTNPEAEKQEYIDGIIENVDWLGYKPFKITYTSDYYDELFNLACELIRRGRAYVCFLSGEKLREQRKAIEEYHHSKKTKPFPKEAVYDANREDLSPEENLELFIKMKEGRFDEGEASLRMKGDFESPNPNMWDHVAYRIKFTSHPRTGDKWCIYPTYDYSHCLVDSLENITHSLCTLEFETRQSIDGSYHWLLDVLDMYHPKTWESSRCSISYNVMSKRRLQLLVNENYVNGWDDPRLLTLAGLRRRGYTPSSIITFCQTLGIARTTNENCVRYGVLESCLRKELDDIAPRRLAIINPLKIIIDNFDEYKVKDFTVPNHPAKPEMGTRNVEFTSTVYIPQEKFRLEMIKGYKGMVPNSPKNNSVRLLNAVVINYKSHTLDEKGNILEVHVTMESLDLPPPKGISIVPWVPNNAISAEARIYNRLFTDCVIDNAEVQAERAVKHLGKKDVTEILNPQSLQIESILIEPNIKNELGKNIRWQFITVGFFYEDLDSTTEKPVFNLTVSLKEDKGKKN